MSVRPRRADDAVRRSAPATSSSLAPQFGGTQQFNAPQTNGPQFGGAQQYAPAAAARRRRDVRHRHRSARENMSLRDTHSDIESSVKKQPGGIALHDYLETMNVMIALLENERGDLRNHSVTVARITRKVCDPPRARSPKSRTRSSSPRTSARHRQDVGVSPDRAQRRRVRSAPAASQEELPDAGAYLRSVRLPGDVNTVLSHMYERYDGQGFPDRLDRQRDLPRRARAL